MQSRRRFIGTTALAALPAAALALTQEDVRAQATAGNDTETRVLRQLAAENARAYNDGRQAGVGATHLRAAAANLRVFAALNLDAQIRQHVRTHGRAHGQDADGVMRHVDRGRLQKELRQAGMALTLTQVDQMLLKVHPTPAMIAEVRGAGFSFSAHLRTLAAMLEKDATVAAKQEPEGPYRRVARLVECDKYAYEINLVSWAAGILCASGVGAAACVAAITSIVLIQTAMYAAGC